jgi:hypothetical protein
MPSQTGPLENPRHLGFTSYASCYCEFNIVSQRLSYQPFWIFFKLVNISRKSEKGIKISYDWSSKIIISFRRAGSTSQKRSLFYETLKKKYFCFFDFVDVFEFCYSEFIRYTNNN